MHRKQVVTILLFIIGVLALAACQRAVEPEVSVDLAGTSWVLSSLEGSLPVAEAPVTLEFGSDGTVSGSDGCNRFSTGFTQEGSNLTIEQPAASTMMACEEAVMNQAATVATALANTTGFSAADDQLSLRAGDRVVATFVPYVGQAEEAAPTATLADTSWMLSALNGDLPLPGSQVTLQFGTDGTVSGTDGCNQFNTTFSQDGTNLTFAQPGASTLMACEEAVMEQATAFMDALGATTTFTMTEEELSLGNDQATLATFVLIPQGLTGTAWDVTAYNNGREAVVGLITGTEISAFFEAENLLSGNAGCNQYFTEFTAENGTLGLGTIGTTGRFCDQPAGVMEQEQEYLAALASATTYSIEGNLLQMRTADDQLAVMMMRRLVVDLPEPEPAVPWGRVTAPLGLNIRTGPGANFPVIGVARNGDEGEIVGRSADGAWWAAAVPAAPDGIGWLSADFVVATNAENVPVLEVAPPVVVAPTPAPTPTPAPAPTATPMPVITFTADSTIINQGQCTMLRWSVENIQAVWVYPQGERYDRFPRTGQGSEQVCPEATTSYEMRVLMRDGSVAIRQLTVAVTGSQPAPNPLSGTNWEVVNVNNGRDAVISVLDGTRLTMQFGADGQVTGNAGCNDYFATYLVEGNRLTIQAPGATSQLCSEPEGVMEQEAAFLSMLNAAATFQISGARLEIRTAGDQIAIVAQQMP